MSKFFNEGLTVDEKILRWNENQAQLKALKDIEMGQRKELIETLFQGAEKGTHNHILGGGYKLKAVLGTETKLDAASFAFLQQEIENLGPEAKTQLAAAVKFTPSLVAAGYKVMTEEVKVIFDQCVVTKPSSPTLELVVPKTKE